MPYLGNVPAEAYSSVVKDSFNGDGSTTAFTMSQPSTTNNVRVVVENVIQDPTVAYTVSGTTLTFTSAPPVGTANIYVVHLGPAVMTTVPPDGVTVTDLNAYADGATAFTANRASSDGTIIDLQKDGSSIGTLGIEGGDLVVDGGSGHVGVRFMAGTLRPRDAGTVSDGGVDLGASNGRWQDLYLSGGVYVGGTGSSNLLDDVEFGTYTPTVIGTNSAGTVTYTQRWGEYTKIGDTVTVWFYVSITAHSGYGGSLGIANLPFTSRASRGATGSLMTYNFNWTTSSGFLSLFIGGGQTYVRLYSSTDDSIWVAQGPRNESYSMYGTLTYKTDS